jgi:hypothetical protein
VVEEAGQAAAEAGTGRRRQIGGNAHQGGGIAIASGRQIKDREMLGLMVGARGFEPRTCGTQNSLLVGHDFPRMELAAQEVSILRGFLKDLL